MNDYKRILYIHITTALFWLIVFPIFILNKISIIESDQLIRLIFQIVVLLYCIFAIYLYCILTFHIRSIKLILLCKRNNAAFIFRMPRNWLKHGDCLTLRKIVKIYNDTDAAKLVVEDVCRFRSFISPWWYRNLFHQFSQSRQTVVYWNNIACGVLASSNFLFRGFTPSSKIENLIKSIENDYKLLGASATAGRISHSTGLKINGDETR